VLKIVRAVQGVHALDLLWKQGLFVDMGVIFRCVHDCVSEVSFLLEQYPEKSGQVDIFLKEFFSKTIEEQTTSAETPVETKKIHNAVVRSLKNGKHDDQSKEMITSVYKTFCGYTHAGYAHILEMFGGDSSSMSFNLSGVPSHNQQSNAHESRF
jgi:hypothetical protein